MWCRALSLVGLTGLASLGLACRSTSPGPGQVGADGDAGPPPVSASEREQGEGLCDAYVARVCACASQDPEFAEECALARSRPEALDLHRQLLAGKMGELNDRERRLTQSGFREIVAGCVSADGALDPARCPRPGVPAKGPAAQTE